MPIQLIVIVILGVFRPGGIYVALKVRLYEIVVVLSVDIIVIILRLVYLSEEAVQG